MIEYEALDTVPGIVTNKHKIAHRAKYILRTLDFYFLVQTHPKVLRTQHYR